jgi:hypothetical protein
MNNSNEKYRDMFERAKGLVVKYGNSNYESWTIEDREYFFKLKEDPDFQEYLSGVIQKSTELAQRKHDEAKAAYESRKRYYD